MRVECRDKKVWDKRDGVGLVQATGGNMALRLTFRRLRANVLTHQRWVRMSRPGEVGALDGWLVSAAPRRPHGGYGWFGLQLH
jgi:hypothetical protein